MSFIIIFVVCIALLFVIAYLTKRRFGVLGLALATGALFSSLWVGDLTPIIASTGVELVRPPLESVVSAALILVPALLLVTSGPAYRSAMPRVIGALLFALLAGVLLLDPLGSALIIDDAGRPVYDFFTSHYRIIVTVCLTLAVVDLLLTKTPKHTSKH